MLLTVGVVPAEARSLHVYDEAGNEIHEYRFLIERDDTFPDLDPTTNPSGVENPDTLSVKFHKSYVPAIAAGTHADANEILNNRDIIKNHTRYFISILPINGDADHTIGGVGFSTARPVDDRAQDIKVEVHSLPLPAAQATLYAFIDNNPVNGEDDQPDELPLPGVRFILSDAGGRYGAVGGQAAYDVFGNLLGTTYQRDANGDYVLDGDGSPIVDQIGDGTVTSGPDGLVTVENLIPGKYGVVAVPPNPVLDPATPNIPGGDPNAQFVQTNTIEGTPTIDIWVQPNESRLFNEVGPAGPHASFGFVKKFNRLNDIQTASSTRASITGVVTNAHTSPPPYFPTFDGGPYEGVRCWVALNQANGAVGSGVYAAPCVNDVEFTIPDVPPGSYRLTLWDENLLNIIASQDVVVNEGDSTIDLGNVAQLDWFYHYVANAFYDTDGDGFPDPGEVGVPGIVMNVRFRDGTMDQSLTTDALGTAGFEEVFPYFAWQIAEIDHLRLKPTGMTAVVDAGGEIPAGGGGLALKTVPTFGILNPQVQLFEHGPKAGQPRNNPNTKNPYSRTEQGPTLLEAMQGFIGTTNVIYWGVQAYKSNEPGDITGVVNYGTTRAEDDPRDAVVEDWEPGIANAPVMLYKWSSNFNPNAKIGEPGHVNLADVDNYPFQWSNPNVNKKGPEDIARADEHTVDPTDQFFHYGDAVALAHTDSWNDSLPTGCPNVSNYDFFGNPPEKLIECFDGTQNFNQIRPGVYDGGYAFAESVVKVNGVVQTDPLPNNPNRVALRTQPLAAGDYVVEVVPPRYVNLDKPATSTTPYELVVSPYRVLDEADKNVDFGDSYAPTPNALNPACIGPKVTLPQYLRIGTDRGEEIETPFWNSNPEHTRPGCNMKLVTLRNTQNAFANFSLLTDVPIATHAYGMVLDDLSNEFNLISPNFGEKFAPPFMSVALRDWSGHTLARTHTDQYGIFDALLPSTWTINVPSPSGVAPMMASACINDGGDEQVDPHHNSQYMSVCYTLQFMPGTTTYLDTPIFPNAAFPGPNQENLVCTLPEGTPDVASVTSSAYAGPILPAAGGTLTITGTGFGATQGSVSIGGAPATVGTWSDSSITVNVPSGSTGGQIVVTAADGAHSVTSARLTMLGASDVVKVVGTDYATIQEALDGATANDVVLVPAGSYHETLIMWKPVRLQGAGAGVTKIFAAPLPSTRLEAYRAKLADVLANGNVTLLPGQANAEAGATTDLPDQEGAALLVLGNSAQPLRYAGSFVDGVELFDTDRGGGVDIMAYAAGFQVTNNVITGNHGTYSGGVLVGDPFLDEDARNDGVVISHNQIVKNGTEGGTTSVGGGGIGIARGADGYRVTDNFICGNFAAAHGGGIAQLGLSDGGLIKNNIIAYNHSFNQGVNADGGGIYVGGTTPDGGGVSEGAGSIDIVNNLITGNLAGAGDGGGIRLSNINGTDTSDPRPGRWYMATVIGNTITNNVAGAAAGGISMQDAIKSRIFNNTIAFNQSTATTGDSFVSAPTSVGTNASTPRPAGIVAYANTDGLNSVRDTSQLTAAQIPTLGADFSNPNVVNNIIVNNQSLHFEIQQTGDPVHPVSQTLVVDGITDLAVVPSSAGSLISRFGILTDVSGADSGHNNKLVTEEQAKTDLFVHAGFNDAKNTTVNFILGTTNQPPLLVSEAADEGGNAIDVRYGPLNLAERDYHTVTPLADDGSGNGGNANVLSGGLSGLLDVDRDGESWGVNSIDRGGDSFALPTETVSVGQ